jgi:hypothetical protein
MGAFKRSEVNRVIEEIVESFSKKSTAFMPGNEIGSGLREHPSMSYIPGVAGYAQSQMVVYGNGGSLRARFLQQPTREWRSI